MNEQIWKSPYDVEISELRVVNQPRSAVLSISNDGTITEVELKNPEPLSALLKSFEDCWEIKIIDRNKQENNQLDFGRYIVEILDEENVIGSLQCDEYSIEQIQS